MNKEQKLNIKESTKESCGKIELFAHNKIAYESIQSSFKTNKKVCVSHATGTGKTILISKCIEDFKDEEVLVLSSSNSILEYFSSYNQVSNNSVKLMTYHKLSILTNKEFEQLLNSNPKLVVLDEYHRCGAPSWYSAVLKLLNGLSNSYILGTSATPVRYLDDGRDMSDELFEGNVVSDISLYDAIVRKILPMPKYVVALYDFGEKISNLDKQVESSKNNESEKDELRKKIDALRNINDSSEYIENIISKHITTEKNFIIFCKDLSHMREMMPIVKSWFKNISKEKSNINIYELYSGNKNPLKELDEYLETIKKDEDSINLLFTIDMLNEGVHAKNIDGVILLRPTISANIYYQQIGRAMSANSSTNPLIFDFVNNSDTIQTTTFFDSLKEALNKVPKEEVVDYEYDINYIINHIHDETKDALDLFLEIEKSLKNSWDFMYEELFSYYVANGHTLVRENDDKKLFNWVVRNVYLYNNNKLEQYKIDKLNEIGFVWNRNELKWEENFALLENHKNEYGNANVTESENPSLFNWLKSQRKAKAKGELDDSKVTRLEQLGVIWDLRDYAWEVNYHIALEIKNSLGHLNITKIKTYTNSSNEVVEIPSKFRTWFTSQKNCIKNGKMKESRLKKFKLLDIELRSKQDEIDARWNQNIQNLLDYKSKYGDTNVPKNYEDKSLRIWVVNVRNNKDTLSQERINELNSIGFIWSTDDYIWEQSFEQLKLNLEMNNYNYDLLLKEEFAKLYRWTQNQKASYALGKLSQYKIDKLNSINIVWNTNEHLWEQSFKNVYNFVKKYGAIIPSLKTHPKERSWIYKQRQLYRAGKLREDRMEKFLSLGYSLN